MMVSGGEMLIALIALVAGAHGGPAPDKPVRPADKAGSALEQGASALADLRAEDAVALFEQAKKEGPYSRGDHIKLWEQLGVAYAYLERSKEALGAFDVLLALDPGRAISYTLSPKVTFVFEQARSLAADRVPPTIDLRWPLGLTVEDRIPIDLEVVADPHKFLKRAQLHWRLKGSPNYELVDVDLPEVGGTHHIELPPVAAASSRDEVIELYLVGYDARRNEVYQWGSETHPREISVSYEQREAWYTEWWIWAIAGTVVAAGASAAVFAATREPGPTIPTDLRVVP
jgi:hypothetical protein